MSPVSGVTFNAFPYADVLYEKLFFTKETENVMSECVEIDDFTYLWGRSNDQFPRFNSLWFMVYFTTFSNAEWRQGGAVNNSAPGWDLTAEFFLENSDQ